MKLRKKCQNFFLDHLHSERDLSIYLSVCLCATSYLSLFALDLSAPLLFPLTHGNHIQVKDTFNGLDKNLRVLKKNEKGMICALPVSRKATEKRLKDITKKFRDQCHGKKTG